MRHPAAGQVPELPPSQENKTKESISGEQLSRDLLAGQWGRALLPREPPSEGSRADALRRVPTCLQKRRKPME